MNNRREHIGIRLSVEGSLVGLVVGAWLWGVVSLGAQVMVEQSTPSESGELQAYVLACPTPQGPHNEIKVAGGNDCLRKVGTHLGTSRKPGAGRAEQADRADR